MQASLIEKTKLRKKIPCFMCKTPTDYYIPDIEQACCSESCAKHFWKEYELSMAMGEIRKLVSLIAEVKMQLLRNSPAIASPALAHCNKVLEDYHVLSPSGELNLDNISDKIPKPPSFFRCRKCGFTEWDSKIGGHAYGTEWVNDIYVVCKHCKEEYRVDSL